jgi:hypothetical protein
MRNKLSNSFSGALRTFAYFMASGTHYMLTGVDYLSLYGALHRPPPLDDKAA